MAAAWDVPEPVSFSLMGARQNVAVVIHAATEVYSVTTLSTRAGAVLYQPGPQPGPNPRPHES